MPAPSDRHDVDIDLTPGTTKSAIIAFFYSNPDNRFSISDIQNQLDISHGSVTTTLARLNNDGLIGKTDDRYFHALEHREDLHRYIASLDQLEKMFENQDKDYDEHTDIESPVEDIDEDELDAEIAELEAELNQE